MQAVFLPHLSRPCDATDAAAGHHADILSMPEVMHLCGLSRSTIYELIRKGEFAPSRYVWRSRVHPLAEVTAWMAGRIAGAQTGVRRMMMPAVAKTPFSGLPFSGICGYGSVRKMGSRALRIAVLSATYDAPCVFFCVAINATEHQIMVWRVVCRAGMILFRNRVLCH